ncbi:MAG TPA: hypothetical protein VNW15_01565 [Rhizomicrobium sp.]|jgi:hypothetical protein|nr:hypothetical protein [Rhizomicrobium sp.]
MRGIGIILATAGFNLPAFIVAAPAWAAAPVIDNERVTVWDVTLSQGETGPAVPQDAVVMFLEGGTIRTTLADGGTRTSFRRFGDAALMDKGATDTLSSGGPAHEIIVVLKDQPTPPVANTSGLPLAFPRDGSHKVLENAKVIVWNYSWTPGTPTVMHFHDKDVVVAYRYDGTLKSVMPDGTSLDNPYKQGEIRFNKANRTHSELLTTERQSAVILELK